MSEENNVIKLEGVLTRVSSLADGGLSIGFHTQEMAPSEKTEVMGRHGQFGYLLFSPNPIQPKDIPAHDPEFEGKTPSHRLRAVIYVLHSQLKKDGKTTMKFDDFYRGQVERLIEQYKEKLSPVEY